MSVRYLRFCPETPWVFFHATAASKSEVGGDRIKDVTKTFQTACKPAGIDDFHIHDLRHTFANWLVMEGVPLLEAVSYTHLTLPTNREV